VPYKNPEDKKEHDKKYYRNNRKRLLKYRRSRREQDREIWRAWFKRKKDTERKEKIKMGQIYKNRTIFS